MSLVDFSVSDHVMTISLNDEVHRNALSGQRQPRRSGRRRNEPRVGLLRGSRFA